jgi:hypothetical protein
VNILDRIMHQFDMRILFGGALLNINGQTIECEVAKQPNGSYLFTSEGKQVCDPLWEHYIEPIGGALPADMFRLQQVSVCDGDATLILPLLYPREEQEEDVDF